MDKWNIDFGTVPVWDDEDMDFYSAKLRLMYDGSNPFPFSLEAVFINDNLKRKNIGIVLTIECKANGQTVINDNFVCVLTAEQRETLLFTQGKWEYKPSNPPEPNLIDRIAGAYAKDFGIVFYYDVEIEQFVTANLMIDFDWRSSNPIITLLRTYDENRCLKSRINGQSSNLYFSYKGIVEGLSHYEICDSHFLLTTGQVDLLNDLAKKLNEKFSRN